MKTKWQHEHRIFVYTQLLTRFGPYENWVGRTRPRGSVRELKSFMSEIASKLQTRGLIVTSDAVHNQVEWAITTQSPITQHHFRTWVLNVAAALETGFIGAREIHQPKSKLDPSPSEHAIAM